MAVLAHPPLLALGLLRLGDSHLILGQRLAEWTGHGPMLEEDIAMANIGLDLIGAARLLLTEAGQQMRPTQSEDQLAYWRDEAQFLNLSLCELPNSGVAQRSAEGDYATTIVRNFLWANYSTQLWRWLAQHSAHAPMRDIAAKCLKEAHYHLEHSTDWLLRFGDGTDESHQRAQAALNALLPYCNELFHDDATALALAQASLMPLPSELYAPWLAAVTAQVSAATLQLPTHSPFLSTGSQGRHTEHMGYVLAEMQSLARAHPEAQW